MIDSFQDWWGVGVRDCERCGARHWCVPAALVLHNAAGPVAAAADGGRVDARGRRTQVGTDADAPDEAELGGRDPGRARTVRVQDDSGRWSLRWAAQATGHRPRTGQQPSYHVLRRTHHVSVHHFFDIYC